MSYSRMTIQEARGKKRKKGSTLSPFSSRLGSDVMVSPEQMDTPETTTGRIGLNVGRYYGGAAAAPIGAFGGAAAGTLGGAALGSLMGLGAQALTGNPYYVTAGGLAGGAAGGAYGLTKGLLYGVRKGVGLGGRAARYFATGTTKLPSEGGKRKKKNRFI
jgi:hypothetical protein